MAKRVQPAKIVVVGGHGFFGRCVVEDLLAHTRARIAVAGRDPRASPSWDADRIELVTLDQHDGAALRAVLQDAAVVVHAAGPYQNLEPSVLAAAIEAGVAYVDLADDRDFVQRAEQLVARVQPSPPVLLGISFVPGCCAWLVDLVRGEFEHIDSIRCIAAPGSRGSRGVGTIRSLLSGAGRRLSVPRVGVEEVDYGWSRPRRVDFPDPIGDRITYLAIAVADFDLFPRWFDCHDVEFRASSDQAWLDRCLWLAASARRFTGFPPLELLSSAFRPLIHAAGRLGTDAGAGMVEITGRSQGQVIRRRVAVVAREQGQRIPALPAAIVAAMLLERHDPLVGLMAPHLALPALEFRRESEIRGLEFWCDEGRGWLPCAGTSNQSRAS